TREPRGRGKGELKELESILHNIIIGSSCRDTWKWSLAENGVFSVKVLSDLVDEKYLDTGCNGNTTLLNKIVPKKINVFVWSALRGRLPVRVELDKKGIDIPNILCPMCDETVETIDHALVLCNKSMRIWLKFFEWWDYGFADSFTTTDMLRHEGGNLVSSNIKVLWEAVMWITRSFGGFSLAICCAFPFPSPKPDSLFSCWIDLVPLPSFSQVDVFRSYPYSSLVPLTCGRKAPYL
ncbi:RNA-directed DNA polymerase, eukaryota, reverse transcriptase zinc-binding domain protein, partial [Tanacetum coccineum]